MACVISAICDNVDRFAICQDKCYVPVSIVFVDVALGEQPRQDVLGLKDFLIHLCLLARLVAVVQSILPLRWDISSAEVIKWFSDVLVDCSGLHLSEGMGLRANEKA